MSYLKTGLSAITITAFVALAVYYVSDNKQQIQLQDIQVKSKESQLIQLNSKYDTILKEKVQTDQQKIEQQKKIDELENERKRLEGELQAKLQRQQAEKQKLATAAQNVSGTAKVSAASGNCQSWMAQAGVPNSYASNELIRRESGCNPYAINKSSGACGIPQNINGCTTYDPVEQLKWMQSYIVRRYSTWENAVAFHNANNWY
jgi:TolA-binding protein